jgi:hypothetical protein
MLRNQHLAILLALSCLSFTPASAQSVTGATGVSSGGITGASSTVSGNSAGGLQSGSSAGVTGASSAGVTGGSLAGVNQIRSSDDSLNHKQKIYARQRIDSDGQIVTDVSGMIASFDGNSMTIVTPDNQLFRVILSQSQSTQVSPTYIPGQSIRATLRVDSGGPGVFDIVGFQHGLLGSDQQNLQAPPPPTAAPASSGPPPINWSNH